MLKKNKKKTSFESCIKPLLKMMHWMGSDRELQEALPHLINVNNVHDFCTVLKNLHYEAHSMDIDLFDIDSRLLPCLMVTAAGDALVLLEKKETKIKVFDGLLEKENTLEIDKLSDDFRLGTLYTFKSQKEVKELEKISWLRRTFLENKALIYNALFLSFIINLLMLATPLFVKGVYNKVIGSISQSMLSDFSIGMLIALVGVYVLHKLRAQHLAIIGARFDRAIGNHIFSHLLYLSPSYTETATVGAQVARIKDFDRLREFFSGPLLTVCFELPFIIVSLVIIAILAGKLVFVPIVLIVIFILTGLILRPRTKRSIDNSAIHNARFQEFLLESISQMRTIKYTASQSKWLERYRNLSAEASVTSMSVSVYNAINLALSDAYMIGAGLAVISFGAVMIMHGTLNIGSMIAVMILIWRVLSPLKMLFNTMPRILQMGSSITQITRLMKLSPESEPTEIVIKKKRKFEGKISFYRVSMRYPTAFIPSLVGVTAEITAGSLVGVVGRNGSGKSTFLKLILGLYQPQAGSIRLDNQDIRQINPIELRKAIGYLPQSPELFYGTVSANMRLADPTASDADLRRAAQEAGVLEDILRLPEGFHTPMNDQATEQLASSFQQQLCLARAYLRDASVLLLDEPANTMDYEADQQLMRQLDVLRGKTTIIMVTHRPSHLKKMDVILLFEEGQLILQGPPNEVIPRIPAELL